MSDERSKRSVIAAAIRLLTFRLTREEFLQFDHRHLIFGLACTWAVGIGRWWDDPGAHLLQHLGIGSVIYVFVLSFLLWLVIWPFRPEGWSYRHVLTFVSLTAPPAILYAIPVERLSSLENARSYNLLFLGTVATWRVVLLFFYLGRYARLNAFSILVAGLLPVTFIIVTLTTLNLERAVFNAMGGLRDGGTANDGAFGVLILLTFLSMILFLPLLACYIALAVSAYHDAKAKKLNHTL